MIDLSSLRRTLFRYAVILVIAGLSVTARGMAQEECGDALNLAQKSYELGRFSETIGLLVDCIEAMPIQEQGRANRLLALAYLFSDQDELADDAVRRLLEIDPRYLSNPSIDPPELTQLIDAYTIFPRMGIGVRGGLAASARKVTGAFGIAGNTTADRLAGEKVFALGSDMGLHFEFALNPALILSQGFIYTTRTVRYRVNNRQPAIRTEYTERLTYANLPLSLRYQFDAGDFSPYLHVGYFTQLLLGASSDIESISDTTGAASGIRTTEDRRNGSNPGLVAGVGFNFKLGDGNLVFEGRYEYGLTSVVIAENRYSDLERAYQFLYVDNDYSLRNFIIQVGYTYPLTFSARK